MLTPGLDHRRLVVHQVQDGPPGVEGVAEGGGDLQQEGVALDQADRLAGVDDGNDEGVGFALEALEDSTAQRLGRNRLGALGQDFDGRHIRP